MPTSIPDGLKRAVADQISPPENEWWIRDLTESYPWLRNAKIYWIIDSKSNSGIVLKDASGSYECLNCPGSESRIGDVIAANLGEVPSETLSVTKLAQLLMEWYQDPRGYVATPEFLDDQEAVLDSWLMGSEKDHKVLRASCVSPAYTTMEDSGWVLIFNAINRHGGVEEWTVRGKSERFEIKSIKIRMLKDNGTFYYPEEL